MSERDQSQRDHKLSQKETNNPNKLFYGTQPKPFSFAFNCILCE